MKTPTLVGVGVTLLGILGLVTFLIATDRDPALLLTALVTSVPLLAVLFQLNVVQKQTNGTLSSLREELAAEKAENKALRTYLPSDTINEAIPPTEEEGI